MSLLYKYKVRRLENLLIEIFVILQKIKIKSSHDVLNDPKLSAVPALEQTENDKSRVSSW